MKINQNFLMNLGIIRKIYIKDLQIADEKFEDHRQFSKYMALLFGFVGVFFWQWDYILDPVNAFLPEVYGMRISHLLIGLIAYLFLSKGLSRKVITNFLIISLLYVEGSITFHFKYINEGFLHGLGGYMYFWIIPIVLLSGITLRAIIIYTMLMLPLPHFMNYFNLAEGFNDIIYAILIWPAGLLVIIVQFTASFAYQKRKDYQHKLKIETKAKEKFFSLIAHDLKAPFHGIISYLEILEDETFQINAEKKQEVINNLKALSEKTYKLLDNLLQWTKLQTEKIKPDFEDLNILNVINETIDLFAPIALKKNIRILKDIDPNLNFYVDKNMVQTIFRNLISNGIKFTKSGGYVSITVALNENYVEFSISDNGIGMTLYQVKSLFNIESEFSTEGTAGEIGTGLGLNLCYELVQLHNGVIRVQSKENTGTTFIVRFPR